MRNLKKNPGAKVWTNQVYQKLYKRAPPKREREMNSPMKKVTSIELYQSYFGRWHTSFP